MTLMGLEALTRAAETLPMKSTCTVTWTDGAAQMILGAKTKLHSPAKAGK